MGLDKLKNEYVCIELKNGSKYFGTLIEIDTSPEYWSWVVIQERNKSKPQTFADSEIVRVEVLE
ncbi:MAG TPA: hypothetical protein VJ912_04305 [Candidatus Nanoarchaeia archaeon]|nr:hypothetical protein [Candidatus Nanoarchaeia archaeon]